MVKMSNKGLRLALFALAGSTTVLFSIVMTTLVQDALWRPSVEYFGVTAPETCRSGERCRLVYTALRRKLCSSKGVPRWYSIDTEAYYPDLAKDFDIDPADITEEPVNFPVSVAVPKGVFPGNWLYEVVVVPRGKCEGDPPIVAPPAKIMVVE